MKLVRMQGGVAIHARFWFITSFLVGGEEFFISRRRDKVLIRRGIARFMKGTRNGPWPIEHGSATPRALRRTVRAHNVHTKELTYVLWGRDALIRFHAKAFSDRDKSVAARLKHSNSVWDDVTGGGFCEHAPRS